MNTKELLKKLTAVPCVCGSEEKMISLLTEILIPYGEVSVDSMNNVCCTFGEGYHILLDAHIDEIGLVVTAITDDGFLKVGASGGIDKRMLLGYEVSVWGSRELRGVISTLPPHLQKSSDEKNVPELDEIAIDIGMNKAEAESSVSLGDKVTFKRHFTELLNGNISANCLDDRAGAALIILALDELKKLPVKITAMFSTQEEIGTRGAKIGPYGKDVDEAIAIDVSFGYTPNCNKEECGELEKGPMIGVSPILSKQVTDDLISVCKNENIDYQLEIMSGRTGTNADVISISQSGVRCGLISIPLKNMHSPVEVINVKDIEASLKLITAFAKRKAGIDNA